MLRAIQWAVTNITEGLEFEYYLDYELAKIAAENMTTLSGVQWNVKDSDGKFWVVQS